MNIETNHRLKNSKFLARRLEIENEESLELLYTFFPELVPIEPRSVSRILQHGDETKVSVPSSSELVSNSIQKLALAVFVFIRFITTY